jgi:mannose-1-phosphate guanylyltransferase
LVSDKEHILTVVAHGYESDARHQLMGRSGGTLLAQPAHCTTTAAIYSSLAYIRTRDPRATVVVYPSDHFVYPESGFLHSVRRVVRTAEWLPDRIVLLGVPPDQLALDYGWIIPGDTLDGSVSYRILGVRAFLENPTIAQADASLAAGALWNTFVLAAKVDVLWDMGWQYFPAMMSKLERLADKIGTSQEARALDTVYQDMSAHDFSLGLLRYVPDRLAVVETAGFLWSDWGKPERITNTLRRIGRQPAFPLTCLNEPFTPLPVAVCGGSVMSNL